MSIELSKIDHLAYACQDLSAGVQKISDILGVEPSFGGRHDLLGTANYLVSLGPECYMEIIGPDPQIEHLTIPNVFQINQIESARITAFAIKEPDIDTILAQLKKHKISFGEKMEMSRRLVDDTLLSWTLTDLRHSLGDGIVPFLINWKPNTVHPAQTSVQGCILKSIRLEHPDPEPLKHIFDIMHFKCNIYKGLIPKIICTIQCPNGTVELS